MPDLTRQAVELGDRAEVRDILAEVCRLTGMGFAAVARVTEHRWVACQVEDRIDFGLDPGGELKIKETICDEIRDCGEAIVIDDVSDDIKWSRHPIPVLYGFRSYCSVPIYLADGSFFGTLCAIDPEPRAINDEAILETLGGFAGRLGALFSEVIFGSETPTGGAESLPPAPPAPPNPPSC